MSIERQAKELDEGKGVLTTTLKDSHTQQHEELNAMKAQLTQYIANCIESLSKKLDEQTRLIEENTKKQHKKLSNVQTITEQEVKDFVQAVSRHNSQHETETAGVRERLSEFRNLFGKVTTRQTELVQSHHELQTMWSNDVALLGSKHTEALLSLLGKYSKTDVEVSGTRQRQLSQFSGDHEELRQLLVGGCKHWKKAFTLKSLARRKQAYYNTLYLMLLRDVERTPL